MPHGKGFASRAQRRYLALLVKKHKFPRATFHRWAEETGKRRLPEHVKTAREETPMTESEAYWTGYKDAIHAMNEEAWAGKAAQAGGGSAFDRRNRVAYERAVNANRRMVEARMRQYQQLQDQRRLGWYGPLPPGATLMPGGPPAPAFATPTPYLAPRARPRF